MTTDWVYNVLWMNSNLLLTISAHNVATVWSYDLKKEVNSSCCDERCVLYPLCHAFNLNKFILNI